MDSTHLHLLLNHFPIIGTMIATFFLLFGLWKDNRDTQQISLIVILIMALIAIPVFLTGEPAEEAVENLPGVIKSLIEEHEEAAEVALFAMMLSGILSLVALIMKAFQYKSTQAVVKLVVVCSIITTLLMAYTGNLGGKIRHTELRSSSTSSEIQSTQSGNEKDND